MRVLIVALVAALGGCYTPGVADCQFSCGAGEACPDGTSCIGGFCRTTTAGTCTGTAIDAAVDAPDDPSCPAPPQSGCGARFKLPGGTCAVVCGREKWDDAAVDAAVDAPDDPSCPAPPQGGCGARFKLPGGTCAVVCGREKWDDAANLCGNGAWEAGKLDTIVKLDALNLQDALWIGASRTSGWTWRDSSPVAAALWTGGTAPTGGSTCGHVTVDRRLSNSHNCNDKLERLCTQR